MARWPKYEPTEEHRRQVMTMAGFGIPQPEIAKLIDISDRTLRTYYRRELDTGATEANMRVAQSLYNMAVRDKIPAAAIWWTKARMGWREPPRDVNLGGQQDNPVAIDFQWAPALPPAQPKEPVDTNGDTPTIDAQNEALVIEWDKPE